MVTLEKALTIALSLAATVAGLVTLALNVWLIRFANVDPGLPTLVAVMLLGFGIGPPLVGLLPVRLKVGTFGIVLWFVLGATGTLLAVQTSRSTASR